MATAVTRPMIVASVGYRTCWARRWDCWHRFRKIARKLGIPDALKLYCARHTFGTVAMAETRDPGPVKEVMGHENLATTMGYMHPETAAIKAVIDRRNQQKFAEEAEPQPVEEQLIRQKYTM